MRIGVGYDVHKLTEGRELWLGGIRIPHSKGALGHSDADVLLHAICDALLGAGAMGDIGAHFPDTDPTYQGIDSKLLLEKVDCMIKERGLSISNVDATLVLQQPKVSSYILQMRETIAGILHLPVGRVSVKATTTEKLGFEGREEGVSAYAIVLLNE